ncbi:putative 1-aminocyclopropane-1-carboxylate deaminase [Aspergillus clavatus NRRL 1]|uniref:1-aminocyclopropane-1-carboxylate deaminase, putative n=1 Tax=Aspergillus clavatus (strain ATCC 1007 / CBS 513.65 / DSM 816 / NCTC 3887 / NRRL 1 / QM 1276 / 107) TaxID=344612 RepID=A1C4Z6_ASPCL|nr:1-aminocyclopropane-1-carboxylate deaminase, putative [Aspergillus clavatus NRRL 1]EAW14764.1 1-aminocyclopropane-1-carboxylate deaminase, putative [Aspergillus clavatus NRRL 1]
MTLSLPAAFAQIPRYPLLYPHPSPIHPLRILSSYLNSITCDPTPKSPFISLFAKREDHSSPLACAGNKYRKLEYIVPDILAPHRQRNGTPPTLVTEGAIQSNHTVQVAAVANRLGLDAIVVLHKGTGGGLAAATDKASFLRTGNVQVVRLLGAEVRVLEAPVAGKEDEDPISGILEELHKQGKAPYWIPSGASLHPLGGLGYARGAFEIAAQEREQELKGSGRFDYIFVACGSGSTVGGLIAGFKLLDKMEEGKRTDVQPRKVIGILNSPTQPQEYHEGRALKFARRTAGLIGLDEQDISMADVRLDDRLVGTAYGVLDTQTNEAMELMARKEGVVLDPVYTAKVIRGLSHWVHHGDLVRDWSLQRKLSEDPNQLNALFIHTGGQAALCAYANTDSSPGI